MKKILFITTRLFWPADDGRKVVLYHYCEGLARQLGYQVHLFSFLENGQSPESVTSRPDFISSVTLARPVSTVEKVVNICKAAFDFDMPLQCCLFISKANRVAIAELVHELSPDVVMVDMVRLAPYIDGLTDYYGAKVINFDDLLSKRYRRQIGKTGEGFLGKYSSQASGLTRALAAGPLKDRLLGLEAKRCESAELRYASIADASLFISPIEAQELSDRIGLDSCFCATMGADLPTIVDGGEPRLFDFGFVGNMHAAANRDSLRFVVNEVLPRLPGRTLRVIGVCPDEVRDAYAGYEAVSFTGRVDSVSDHLHQCKIMLAPLAYGTGIKTKVLEAMGMGVPVVTNSLGLEGISAQVGRDVLCSDDAEGLAEAARNLIEDDELCSQIASNGRNYVLSTHTWDKSIADLGKCLDYAIASRSERAL